MIYYKVISSVHLFIDILSHYYLPTKQVSTRLPVLSVLLLLLLSTIHFNNGLFREWNNYMYIYVIYVLLYM